MSFICSLTTLVTQSAFILPRAFCSIHCNFPHFQTSLHLLTPFCIFLGAVGQDLRTVSAGWTGTILSRVTLKAQKQSANYVDNHIYLQQRNLFLSFHENGSYSRSSFPFSLGIAFSDHVAQYVCIRTA